MFRRKHIITLYQIDINLMIPVTEKVIFINKSFCGVRYPGLHRTCDWRIASLVLCEFSR